MRVEKRVLQVICLVKNTRKGDQIEVFKLLIIVKILNIILFKN